MYPISINNKCVTLNNVNKGYKNSMVFPAKQKGCDTVSFSGKAKKPIALILAITTPFIAGRALAENRNPQITPTPLSVCSPIPTPPDDSYNPSPIPSDDSKKLIQAEGPEEEPPAFFEGIEEDTLLVQATNTKVEEKDSYADEKLNTEAPFELPISEENKSDETSTTKTDKWEGLKPYLVGIALGVPTVVAIDSARHAIKTIKRTKQEEENQSRYIDRL